MRILKTSSSRGFDFDLRLLKVSAFLILLARGWIYFEMDGPFRELLYRYDFFGKVVELFGLTWDLYVRNIYISNIYPQAFDVVGFFFAVVGIEVN